jgi:hypothetical protein
MGVLAFSRVPRAVAHVCDEKYAFVERVPGSVARAGRSAAAGVTIAAGHAAMLRNTASQPSNLPAEKKRPFEQTEALNT